MLLKAQFRTAWQAPRRGGLPARSDYPSTYRNTADVPYRWTAFGRPFASPAGFTGEDGKISRGEAGKAADRKNAALPPFLPFSVAGNAVRRSGFPRRGFGGSELPAGHALTKPTCPACRVELPDMGLNLVAPHSGQRACAFAAGSTASDILPSSLIE